MHQPGNINQRLRGNVLPKQVNGLDSETEKVRTGLQGSHDSVGCPQEEESENVDHRHLESLHPPEGSLCPGNTGLRLRVPVPPDMSNV